MARSCRTSATRRSGCISRTGCWRWASVLGVLALAIAARGSEVRPLAWLAVALVAIEIALGAAVVLGEVPFGTALAHQALGVLVFTILSLVLWRAHGRTSETEIAHGLSHA